MSTFVRQWNRARTSFYLILKSKTSPRKPVSLLVLYWFCILDLGFIWVFTVDEYVWVFTVDEYEAPNPKAALLFLEQGQWPYTMQKGTAKAQRNRKRGRNPIRGGEKLCLFQQ